MQDLSNEMEDLFRKAVELYPLKACESQWEGLSTRIKSKKRRLLFVPWVIIRKNSGMHIFFGVMLLVPITIISLVPFSQQKAINRLSKSNTNSNASSPIVNISSGQPFSRLLTPVYPGPDYENPSYRTVAVDIGTVTTFNRMAIDPSETNVVATNSLIDTYIPLLYEQQSEKRTPNAIHLNLPLQHIGPPGRRGLYVGVFAGALFSGVENLGVNKSGFDGGILIGYTLSKKLSIETGLSRTRQYFTAGGDFLHKELGMNGATSLDGSRSALSVPLKLKYNLCSGSSGNIFLTTGLSSFFNVEDHILITVNYLPVPPSNEFQFPDTRYFPNYLNFSLGYEYKIGKTSSLRIEPYLEIPINSSAGNSFKTHQPEHYVQLFNSGIHISISNFIH